MSQELIMETNNDRAFKTLLVLKTVEQDLRDGFSTHDEAYFLSRAADTLMMLTEYKTVGQDVQNTLKSMIKSKDRKVIASYAHDVADFVGSQRRKFEFACQL